MIAWSDNWLTFILVLIPKSAITRLSEELSSSEGGSSISYYLLPAKAVFQLIGCFIVIPNVLLFWNVWKRVLFVAELAVLLSEGRLVDNGDNCECCSAVDRKAEETKLVGYIEIIIKNSNKQVIDNNPIFDLTPRFTISGRSDDILFIVVAMAYNSYSHQIWKYNLIVTAIGQNKPWQFILFCFHKIQNSFGNINKIKLKWKSTKIARGVILGLVEASDYWIK